MIEWHISPGSLAIEPAFLTTTGCHSIESVPGGNERGKANRGGAGQASGARRALALSLPLHSILELRKPRPGQGQRGAVCEWMRSHLSPRGLRA